MSISLSFRYRTHSIGITDLFPHLEKKSLKRWPILEYHWARSFKLCMIITLRAWCPWPGVNIVIVRLMPLTLFHSHRCCRNIYCRLCFFQILVYRCLNVALLRHTLKRSRTKWFVGLYCVLKGDKEYVFGRTSAWDCRRRKHCNFLKQHICAKFQTFHAGTTYWTSSVHTTVSYPDHFSKSQRCHTVLTENVTFLPD